MVPDPLDFLSRNEWFASRLWRYYVQILHYLRIPIFRRPTCRPYDRFPSDNFLYVDKLAERIATPIIVLYSCIFMFAWKSEFPTPTERLLWRIKLYRSAPRRAIVFERAVSSGLQRPTGGRSQGRHPPDRMVGPTSPFPAGFPNDPPAPPAKSFFARSVHDVAPDLIGATFLFGNTGGVIVEVEAYHHTEPAAHSMADRRSATP